MTDPGAALTAEGLALAAWCRENMATGKVEKEELRGLLAPAG